ncbi:LCP family protein [Butyricicoccus sp.]|uniref:LCP family protein n=1 Tax=Butyricicoccus sp. TaxID=2049021 RepID=UPI003F18B0EA
MKRKRNKLPRRILNILVIIAAVCVVGYFGFCYWVNASGSLVGDHLPDPADVDQGSAIVVNGAGRREGVFTLFIGATDEDEIRTDSMMVLVFDTENHRADLINIPRDTLVDCERTGAGRKINAAYASGVDEMLDEVSTVIGFRPDKYVVANFDGIAEIVDVIGGVDYDVPFDMSYHDASQDLSIEFKKGYQHLDGEEVVEFLRWRHNDDGTGYDDGDIGRVTKLQDFLVTVGSAVLSPTNVLKIPSIAAAVSNNVETDLTTSQILWLGMQGMKMDMQEDISMQTLIGDSAMVNFGDNIWFYILDEDMVIDQINETFNPYTRTLTEEDFSIVTPDTYGIYSESWRNERAVRYAGYKKSDTSEDDDDTEEDADTESEHSGQEDEEVVYYHDD